MRLSLFSSKQCIIKQLLDSVFVISEIIKVLVSVISLSLRLRLITLTSTLIILDITKTSSNNCLLFAVDLRSFRGPQLYLTSRKLCPYARKKTYRTNSDKENISLEISNGKEKSYDRSHYFLAQRIISIQRRAKVRISGERKQIEKNNHTGKEKLALILVSKLWFILSQLPSPPLEGNEWTK